MSRSRSAALAVAALLVTLTVVNLADAQERRGGRGGRFGGGFGGMMGSPLFLIGNEKVQEELELLDDQKAEVRKALDELRAGFGQGGAGGFQQLSPEEREKRIAEAQARAKTATDKINSVLLPHQANRLKEISLQVRGTDALRDDEVAKELSLTDEQKQTVADIQREAGEQRRALFQQGGEGDREANRQKAAELQTATNEKLLAVLTDEQRQQFDSMQGEKFEGVDELRRPRGFGGGRGGPGGPGGGRRGARPAQGDE